MPPEPSTSSSRLIKPLALLIIALSPFYPAPATSWLLLILLGAWLADGTSENGDVVRSLLSLRTLPFYVVMACGVIFLEKPATPVVKPAVPGISGTSTGIAQRRFGSNGFESSNTPSASAPAPIAMRNGTPQAGQPTLPVRPPGPQPTGANANNRPPSQFQFTPAGNASRPPLPGSTTAPTVRPGPATAPSPAGFPSSIGPTKPVTTTSSSLPPAAPAPSAPPAPPAK